MADFQVDVWDPTWDGNRVVAYDASGSVIGGVEIPGDHTPGKQPPTVERALIAGPGIRAVDLIPASADYVAYDAASFVFGGVALQCSPNPIPIRATEVTCTATPATGEGTVLVTQWRFEGPELSAPVVEQSSAPEWSGLAVTNGDVFVEGEVDGVPAAASTSLLVNPRDWSQDTVRYTLQNLGTDNLPLHPDSANDLGNHEGAAGVLVRPDGFAEVPSGPNKGVFYLTEVPVEAFSRIRINYDALSIDSDFYNLQPRRAPANKCTRDSVLPFVPLAEDHEGLTLSATSHAGVLRNELNAQAPQTAEHVVALGDLALLQTKAQAAAQLAIDDAKQKSRDQNKGGLVPPIQYCAFRFF